MKKFALVLCAMMTLSCMNSVFASSVTNKDTESRNTVKEFTDSVTGNMPSFRAGDVLKFNVSGLTNGRQLTIISYKVNGEIGNDTVQYIDQRTINASSNVVEYKIRDINDGIYCVAIKDENDTAAYKLYYKVGTPKFEVIKGSENTDYYVKTEKTTDDGTVVYSVGYLAAAQFKTNELSLDDYGINGFGFRYSLDGVDVDVAPTLEQLEALKAQINELKDKTEGAGEFSFHYINTIKNVPENDVVNITAKATMYDSDKTTITVEQ